MSHAIILYQHRQLNGGGDRALRIFLRFSLYFFNELVRKMLKASDR